MKVVIDEKIPFLKDALCQMGHVVYAMPGNRISKKDIHDAGALFVRTRTICDASLLGGTSIEFIGTATIGYDHIDRNYCHTHNIKWTNAPGCNADAVLQYIQCTIYSWAKRNNIAQEDITLGVIGVGQIGQSVAKWAASARMRLLLNDPPREAAGEQGFAPLEKIADECNVITFHPTLTKDGDYPSFHLADSRFFLSLRKRPLIINASRGPVVDNTALLEACNNNLIGAAAIDVWENEPDINIPLLNKVYIATPHIAGYSAEGKLNATRMMIEAFAAYTNYTKELPHIALPFPLNRNISAHTIQEALLQIYSPEDETAALKNNPEKFEDLRNNYKLRREPSAYNITII